MLRPWNLNMEVVRGSHTPIHVQIAETIIDEIQRGRFLPGSALPGTRELSNKLNINRKTVVQAYDELISKGWLTAESKRGTFVSSRILAVNSPVKAKKAGAIQTSPNKYRIPDELLSAITSTSTNKKQSADYLCLSHDAPDARLLPYQQFARAMRHAITSLSRNNKLHYADPKGSTILREAVHQMLNMERGLNADLDNICILRGSQMGLFLAARLLVETGDCVVVERLSNPIARETFKSCGAKLLMLNHDQHGIDLEALEKLCINHLVRAIYVTPQHQIPTGVIMPVENRKGLLALAQRYDFAIIEDDSGCEFNFASNPLPPLASLDKHGHVIYLGSLSKTLAAGFRIGYMVAPAPFIQQCASDITMIDRQGNVATELAVAELLHMGEIKKHISKSLKIYQERKAHAVDLINTELSEFCSVNLSSSGLSVWLDLMPYIHTSQLIEDAETLKLKLVSADCFSEFPSETQAAVINRSGIAGLRLGFAHLNQDEMTSAIKRLRNAFLRQSRLIMQA